MSTRAPGIRALISRQDAEPIAIRQLDVEQDDVGPIAFGRLHGGGGGARFRHDLDLAAVQHATQALADHGVVVDDEDADRVGRAIHRGLA